MRLNQYIQAFLPAVEAELRSVLEHSISVDYPELRHMVAYHMGWEGEGAGPEAQGKRIRPILVLLSTAAAGGEWERSLPAAAAVELLHNFSLIHDDIEDKSELRRGRPTVWARWGIAQAINTGDVMYAMSFEALSRLRATVTPTIALHSYQVLQRTCLDLTRGQYLDISYEDRNQLELNDYWPMVEGKTAALLAACAELGAVSAGVEDVIQIAFRHFGHNLGLAFQVQDDLLGIWGTPYQTGKSAESDLASGKKTLPVLFGLSQAGNFARRWQTGSISPQEVPQVAEMLACEGAREFTEQNAQRLSDLALQSLKNAAPESPSREALEELIQSLLGRKA